MNSHCALCGRVTLKPAVMIVGYPVGPTCARKANLMPLAKRKSGMVFAARGRMSAPVRDSKTLDLFAEA